MKLRSNVRELLKKTLAPTFAALLTLPVFTVAAQAQGPWWERDDDRREEKRERRQERRERRRERREERRERRAERRDDYYNDGYYNDGYYRRNDGYYNGSAQLRQTALNAGYNNGVEEGRKDRSRGDRYDFRDEGDYRKATDDYSSRLGDKELYKRYFRQGFENGYRAGYGGY